MLPVKGASLAMGASGAYDGRFESLASLLVSSGQCDATLLVGWSPLDPKLPWAVENRTEAVHYVSYYRQIVTAMRHVAGGCFSFAFQYGPVPAAAMVSPASLYPGSRYVSKIALSVYDETWSEPVPGEGRWYTVAWSAYGPEWAGTFARDEHKDLVVVGLALATPAKNGAGDDPEFVRGFFSWARSAGVSEVIVWDRGSSAISRAAAPRSFAALAAELIEARAG